MVNAGLFRLISKPVAGLALFSTVTIVFPAASIAQLPKLQGSPMIVAQNTVLDRNYTLGGGDLIKVNVFEVPEYTGDYQIPPGGAINLPLIGSVSVEGLTTGQAADEISQKYSRFLKRPLISVNLLSARGINVVVSGEVTRPGAYTVTLSTSGGNNPGVQYPTILRAIEIAQGTTLSADPSRVELHRRLGRGPEQVSILNLKQIIQLGNVQPQELTLRDGDVIVVPRSNTVNLADVRQLSTASFAADPTKPRVVAVVGEVYRPGTYVVTTASTEGANSGTGATGQSTNSLTGLPTVTRAIQQAGGITPLANIRRVQIRRPTRTGGEQTVDVNLWQLLQTGDINQDAILQDGDTIIIPTATEINRAEATQLATTTLSPATMKISVVGEVKKPGQIDLQPNTSLNQALLASGGFNDARANSKAVDLVRLNPDGSVTKRLVKIDLKASINESTNPILRNNDIVLVSRSGGAKVGDSIGLFTGPLGGIFGLLNFFRGF